jgi:hypothetical protein
MRRHWLLSVLMVGFGALGLTSVAPPASAAPGFGVPTTCETSETPAGLSGANGPQHGLITTANALAADGRLDEAEHLYELARTSRPVDADAGTGLAYVRARRLAASDAAAEALRLRDARLSASGTTSAAAEKSTADVQACLRYANDLDKDTTAAAPPPSQGPSAAESAADRWNAFYKRWVHPAAKALPPALVVLIVLLVATRFLTAVVAPTSARAWPVVVSRIAWWIGLLLLATAAARIGALLTSSWSALRGEHGERGIVALAVVAVSVVAIVVLGRSADAIETVRRRVLGNRLQTFRNRWQRGAHALVLGLSVAAAVAGTLLVAGVIATESTHRLSLTVSAAQWDWLFVLAVMGLGMALHAAGRGHALRLRVQVKQKGDPDAAGTAHILGMLQQLGTAAPRGLTIPQQVDVTDLPSAALSSLPSGKVAAAVTSILGLLQPSVPWRATIEDEVSGGLVVTLTRNGRVAHTAAVDANRFEAADVEDKPSVTKTAVKKDETNDATTEASGGRTNLLTAAAALVLTQLALRHTTLRAGLCGATSWESVAAYVVATRPSDGSDDDALRTQLLAFAVDRDPGNALARAAFVMRLGGGDLAAAARGPRLEELCNLVEGQWAAEVPSLREGYDPLRLRVRHALAALWLNVCAADFAKSGKVLPRNAVRARRSYEAFIELLRETSGHIESRFMRDLRAVAVCLHDGLTVMQIQGAVGAAPADWAAAGEPASLRVVYDRACTQALNKKWFQALEDLELASGREELRQMARQDPAFARFRRVAAEPDDWSKRFWEIVGEPWTAREFTDLPVFEPSGSSLGAMGIGDAQALLLATRTALQREQLAARLGVLVGPVVRWRAVAALDSDGRREGRWAGGIGLELLLAVGVRSLDELSRRAADPTSQPTLREALDAELQSRGQRGLSPKEFEMLTVLRQPPAALPGGVPSPNGKVERGDAPVPS